MTWNMNTIDRRRFLRGGGVALALPMFGSLLGRTATGGEGIENPKRLACFYFPDGVPMPLPEDPAYQDWAWRWTLTAPAVLIYVALLFLFGVAEAHITLRHPVHLLCQSGDRREYAETHKAAECEHQSK